MVDKPVDEAPEAPHVFRHGDDCPHCVARKALLDLVKRNPPPWDQGVFGLTLILAEFIAANPDPAQRLNAQIYVRRHLPQIVGEEEQNYARTNPEKYATAKVQGSA